jgi:hypothetical protein
MQSTDERRSWRSTLLRSTSGSRSTSIWPALRQLVRGRNIQIVHSHDYKTNFYARLLSKVEPVVPLATLHGYRRHDTRALLLRGRQADR